MYVIQKGEPAVTILLYQLLNTATRHPMIAVFLKVSMNTSVWILANTEYRYEYLYSKTKHYTVIINFEPATKSGPCLLFVKANLSLNQWFRIRVLEDRSPACYRCFPVLQQVSSSAKACQSFRSFKSGKFFHSQVDRKKHF